MPSHQLVFLPIVAQGPGESQCRICNKHSTEDIRKVIGAGSPAGLDINSGLNVSLYSGKLNVSGFCLNHSTVGSGKVRQSGLAGVLRSVS